MNSFVKIGTRDSKLALVQANCVKKALAKNNIKAKIIRIKSQGDLNLSTPLYEFGITGIFTKTLDIALLNGEIDLAVHSYKDVPTVPAKGIKIDCVLKREDASDVIILSKKGIDFSKKLIIATSSIRRKCQWLFKYPHHKIIPIRGNVDTRIKKLSQGKFDGAIFALAGIKRLNLEIDNILELNWMIPSAAQGTIAVASKEENNYLDNILNKINCKETFHAVNQEREFIRLTRGGCSKPIAAHAFYEKNKLILKTNICSIDGKRSIEDRSKYDKNDTQAGSKSFKKIKELGGIKILDWDENDCVN